MIKLKLSVEGKEDFNFKKDKIASDIEEIKLFWSKSMAFGAD